LGTYDAEDAISGNYDQQKSGRIKELERANAEKLELIEKL